ncbi:unnamed protein product [Allacma fusca]|uniref:BTB domain-containing protein n=1 Tax=Allacma fusca TaxID=39272 RepID=A0A8J2KHU3_9HEXA|nr:unnamed protein product [Allacma fusca]
MDESIDSNDSLLPDGVYTRTYERMTTKSSLFENLLELQCQSNNFTDLRLSIGNIHFLIHRIVLFSCLTSSGLMTAIDTADKTVPIVISVPGRITPEDLTKIIRFLYLGEVLYLDESESDLKFALEWFGIRENQIIKVRKPYHKDFIQELAEKFRKYFVRYSENERDFLMDWECRTRPVLEAKRSQDANTSTSFSCQSGNLLYCDNQLCGRIFRENFEHEKSGCTFYSFKPLSRAPPGSVLHCPYCRKRFVKFLGETITLNRPNAGSSTFLADRGRSRKRSFEGSPIVPPVIAASSSSHISIDEGSGAPGCQDCRGNFTWPSPPQEKSLSFSGGIKCEICNISFGEATSTDEGLFKHYADQHDIKDSYDYVLYPEPKCRICSQKDQRKHPKESPQGFLHFMIKCKEHQKVSKKKPPKQLTQVHFNCDVPIPNPESTKWWLQIKSSVEIVKHEKRTRSASRGPPAGSSGTNKEKPGPSTSKPPLPKEPSPKPKKRCRKEAKVR